MRVLKAILSWARLNTEFEGPSATWRHCWTTSKQLQDDDGRALNPAQGASPWGPARQQRRWIQPRSKMDLSDRQPAALASFLQSLTENSVKSATGERVWHVLWCVWCTEVQGTWINSVLSELPLTFTYRLYHKAHLKVFHLLLEGSTVQVFYPKASVTLVMGFVLMGTGGPILNTDNGSTVCRQPDPQWHPFSFPLFFFFLWKSLPAQTPSPLSAMHRYGIWPWIPDGPGYCKGSLSGFPQCRGL